MPELMRFRGPPSITIPAGGSLSVITLLVPGAFNPTGKFVVVATLGFRNDVTQTGRASVLVQLLLDGNAVTAARETIRPNVVGEEDGGSIALHYGAGLPGSGGGAPDEPALVPGSPHSWELLLINSGNVDVIIEPPTTGNATIRGRAVA